ncbi:MULTISPECIES: hypothetical protein [unclassified Luteococcus]|uniref:hypothetical protein n=1 Tax=unclassified Luteococcus TaxID=2639923 RepID=UPI00313D352F
MHLDPATILIRGATLTGMAAAARLAKAGHHVVLDADGLPDGGHWASLPHLGVEADELPQHVRLPATWRDLFKKSGRAFDAELTRHGLRLVPAPEQVHRFADGRQFVLPSERGAQHQAVREAFGEGTAQRWTALLDELDELWQQLRRVGLEEPADEESFTRATRDALAAKTTLDELAERPGNPHLARIIRSQGLLAGALPGRNPALLAVRLAIHRRFSHWQLVDEAGHSQRASRLVDLLAERLELRGVERIGAPAPLLGSGLPDLSDITPAPATDADVLLDTIPHQPVGLFGRTIGRPAMAPTVRHELTEALDDELAPLATCPEDPRITRGIVEVVDHGAGNPVVSWHRPLPDGRVLVTIHDHNHPRPDLSWGLAPTSFKHWQQRPKLKIDQRRWQASSASHAGPDPWGELLSAALAAYEIHEELTGEDIRPTNRTPPPPRRQARPARR